MTNSHFDETDGTWVWDYQTDDETHHLFMDIGELTILSYDIMAVYVKL